MQIFDQPLDDCPAVEIRCRREFANHCSTCGRPANRAEHGQPEPLRIAFVLLYENPRGASGQARMINPGAQQHRLAASGGRRQLRHTRRPRQTVVELEARYDQVVSRRVRTVQNGDIRLRDTPWEPDRRFV